MAQKLNKKLVGLLVVSIMVLMTVTGFVLLKNLPDQDPTRYALDGEKFLKQGDYEKAEISFHRAFTKDPNQNPDYLVSAAKCAIELSEVGRARQYLQLAKVRDGTHKGTLETDLDLEFEIAPFMSTVNQWNEIIARARDMAAMNEFSESAKVHHALGRAYLELRKEDATYNDKGEEELKKSIGLDPTNVKAISLLVENKSRLAQEKEAERLPDEARAIRAERLNIIASAIEKCQNPEDADKLAELKELQARCLIIDGEVDKGLAQLRELAAKETSRVDARLMLGRLLTGVFRVKVNADLSEAERLLKSAVESDPTSMQAYFALGTVLKMQAEQIRDEAERQRKLDECRALYSKGLESIPVSKHFRKLANNRARVQFFEELFLMDIARAREAKDAAERERHLAAAEKLVEKLKEERPPDTLEVRFMTSHLYSARGDVIAATREAEAAAAMPEGANNAAVLRLLADLYGRQKQWGVAQETLQKLLPLDPGDPTLYTAMARMLLQLDRADAALAFLKPNEPAVVRQALETNREARLLRIDAYTRLKQFDLAKAEREQMGDDTPDDAVLAAKLLASEGKHSEAEAKVRQVLVNNPTHDGAVRTLLQIFENTGRRADGRAFIDDLISKNPDNRQFQEYRIALSDDMSDDERDNMTLEFINEEKDELTRLTSLVGFYERRNELDKAVEFLDQAEQVSPENSRIIDAQFTLALRQKKWDRAARYAKRSAELNIDGTQGKIAEGRLVLARAAAAREQKKNDEATQLFDQAIDLMRAGLDNYPNFSQGWTYLAGAYLDSGRTEEAKTTLLRALQINPTNSYASLFLGRIAQSEGDEKAERRYLAEAAKALPEDSWVKDRLRHYGEKDDPKTGITAREALLKEKPEDVENLVVLARLYADPKVAAHDKAVDCYRKALAASKNDLGVAIEFADFYSSEEVNQPAEGEKLLREMFDAEEDKPRRAMAAVALGRFFEKQKELATADRHMRQAAFLDPSIRVLTMVAEFYARTGKLKESSENYEKLIELAAGDPAKVQEFRSRLAATLLSMGDLERAKDHIDRFMADYPANSEGLILFAAYHRISGDVEKAKSALDAHIAKDPDNPVAHWQRGQLYLLMGRWELAIDDLKKAKAYKPDGFNYQHRIALADALIEAGRSEEAISELQMILEAKDDEASVAESLLDAYTRVRPARFADAENLIYRFQSRFPRDPRWPTLLGKLGELAQDWDKAIVGYERAAEVGSYRPDMVLALFKAYRSANKPQKIIQCASDHLSAAALERMPEALSALAWAYGQLKIEDKCHETFDRALKSAGSSFETYSRVVGDIVTTLGPEAALRRAQEQSQADPENVAKLQAMVHLLRFNGQTEEAIKTCDKIIALAGGDADLIFGHLAKGMLLSGEKRYVEARKEYEEILKLNPDQPMTLNNLAYLLGERLNLPAEALPYAKKAAQLQPRDANVLDTYGWTLYLNKKYGEAAGTLLRAIEMEGDRMPDTMKNADLRYHLGLLYREQGRPEDAQAMLLAAKKLVEIQNRHVDVERRGDTLPKRIEEALKDLN